MAHRRARTLLILASLLLAAQPSDGQSPGQPPLPPSVSTPPKLPELVPQVKELSAQETDGLIEKAFGKGCQELKRPVRVWIPDISMIIAAETATMAPGKLAVHFRSASVRFLNSGDAQILRGDEIVVSIDQPILQPSAVTGRRVNTVKVHGQNSTVTLSMVPTRTATLNAFPSMPPTVVVPPPPPSALEEKRAAIEQAVLTEKIRETTFAMTSRPMEIRFKFKIDPKARLSDLLPASPKTVAKLPHWANENLTKVPEVAFGEPISKELAKHKAMETTAHVMAKVNHLNLKKTDGFMLAMLNNRSDLHGLPFLMGEECRTQEEQAKVFNFIVENIHHQRRQGQAGRQLADEAVDQFWLGMADFNSVGIVKEKGRFNRAKIDQVQRATVAALMQIMMPESELFRLGLARYLATIPHVEATRALAKLAIFSPEDEVRAAAIEGLRLRREKDYTEILLQGFRYPLPAVSKRAAEAIVKLERKDLLANLVDVLESPDPRLPVTEKHDGKEVTFVRELVKVNHHRNCLLCHAPGNTDSTPDGILKVAVPLPSEPLPKPSDGGGYQSVPPPTPDIVVRLDMTYLRQDFSLMMPVRDSHPWPEMQRFDFLVRTRTLTAAEAQAYEQCCEDEPGRLSPYHRSALFALRELTGRDTEPTAASWRKLLKLAAK